MKKTKIVATIGPASMSQQKLEQLIKAGMNVIRLNFSHGDFAEHQEKVTNGKKASKKLGMPVAFLQDFEGPNIRTGIFYNDPDRRITLKKGQQFILTIRKVVGDETITQVNYNKLPKEVKVGYSILVDDGKRELKVIKIKGSDVVTKVIVGGEIKGRRSLNIPEAKLSLHTITKKDWADLEFGIKNDVDFIAPSFVRNAQDVRDLRKVMDKRGLQAGIISKIETPQGIENIDEIIEVSDGIMVARGDLAVEVPAAKVPSLQKMIIRKCNEVGKPVITATQMLDSMIHSPRPTRAEVSDVANAIVDGTDAIMLSEETSLGEYPVEAVKMMTQVALETEGNLSDERFFKPLLQKDETISIGDSITAGAVKNARRIGARHIIAVTESGYNARMMSRHKPQDEIIVITNNEKTFQTIQLSYGCYPIFIKKILGNRKDTDKINTLLLKGKMVQKGDRVVYVMSSPFGEVHEPNTIFIDTV